MYGQKFSRQIVKGLSAILACLITASMWIFLPTASASAAPTWVSCVPVQVMNYQSRVHIKCASAIGGIIYFAAPTKDPAFVARTLSILSTAQVAGRTLTLLYDPADQSGSAIGCQTNDCRLIQAVGFGQ